MKIYSAVLEFLLADRWGEANGLKTQRPNNQGLPLGLRGHWDQLKTTYKAKENNHSET
jgi:hypothetical protein